MKNNQRQDPTRQNRPMVKGNEASDIDGKAFDFEYGPDDAPNVELNKVSRVGAGGSAYSGRIVQPPKSLAPWWKAGFFWLLKTMLGRLIGSLLLIALSGWGITATVQGWLH